ALVYPGEDIYAGSQSGPITVSVGQAATTLSLTPSPDGQSVTVTLGLPAGFPSALLSQISGPVSLFDGDQLVASSELAGTNSAQFSLRSLTSGMHDLRIEYAGNDLFAGATYETNYNFQRIPDSFISVAASAAATVGKTLTISAKVTATGTPMGNV